MLRRALFALVLVPLSASIPRASAGVPGPAPTSTAASPNAKEQARELFVAGVQLYEAGDYAAALTKFSEAWVLVPVSPVRLNIARCQEKLGRTATAWAEYKATAADAQTEGKAKVETQATEAATKLEPKVPYLTVTVTPSDAVVEIDGAAVASNVAVPVDPGTRVVTVRKGPKSKKVSVVIADSDKKKLAVAL